MVLLFSLSLMERSFPLPASTLSIQTRYYIFLERWMLVIELLPEG